MTSDNSYCHRCGNEMSGRVVSGAVRPSCDSCGAVVFLDPKLAVVVIVSSESRILMVKRDIEPMMGRWSFPSGYVDRGEIVEDAAIREVREETNVQVTLDRLLGVYSGRGNPVVLIAYAAHQSGGTAEAGDETQAVEWFPIDDLPPLPFPHDEDIMRDWRETATP